MIRCIQCGQADLKSNRVQLHGTVRGENYTVEMQGLECPSCHYKTIEGAAMPEFGRLLADKYRATHGLLTSDEIRAWRERLEMSQAKFANYLGVGLASIKRWEMGKIQDRRSNDIIKGKTTDSRILATQDVPGGAIITSTAEIIHDIDVVQTSWLGLFKLRSCGTVLPQSVP